MNNPPLSTVAPTFAKILRELRDRDYRQGVSLPGDFYTDPQWLQIECERLFASNWVRVGRVEEVSQPGDYFACDHVGEPVLVVHGRDGVIRWSRIIASNRCRCATSPTKPGQSTGNDCWKISSRAIS